MASYRNIGALWGKGGQKSSKKGCTSPARPGGNAWDMGKLWKELSSQTNGRACPQHPGHPSGAAIPGAGDKELLGKAAEAAGQGLRD